MPGSIIKNIKGSQCGWDRKPLDKHSHKDLMRCLYRSNVEIFRAMQNKDSQDKVIKNLQGELAKFIVKEEEKKADTGLMDVKEPLEIVKDDDGKSDAKELLKAEKNGKRKRTK